MEEPTTSERQVQPATQERGTQPRRTIPVGVRVWLFIPLLAVTALAIYVGMLDGRTPPSASISIPWPLLAVAFAITELRVVEVHFRRESHSFSLSEFPTVIAMFLLPPGEFLAASLAGSAIALVVGSRQPRVKIAFNLANYAFVGAASLTVFYAFVPAAGSHAVAAWIAAFAATLLATLLSALTIATVITLSGGAPQYQKLPEMLQFGGMVAVANTSLALLAVSLIDLEPALLWLLGLPVAIVFIAYRSFLSEREKHERLELLYQSSRILQHSPQLDSALIALLEHARNMFRAHVAEIVLFPRDRDGDALRITATNDGSSTTVTPMDLAGTDEYTRAMTATKAYFALAPTGDPDRESRHMMVSPLRGEAGTIGAMMIRGRLTRGTSFTDDDLRLLETLANQAAPALENGQLEQSLAELSRLKEQLRYQAYHDSLTDLANRSLFLEALDHRIATATQQRLATVLFLDLDDFKLVNDSLGHAAGDQLLVVVADRIRRCVRDDDVPARLGGDEFAVLIDDNEDLGRATAIAKRILAELAVAVPIGGQDLTIKASIGIAVGKPGISHAREVLRNADVAMYTAKATAKGQIAVFDPTMHAAIVAKHELSSELSRSLGRGELVVLYQPIVSLDDGHIRGVEALLRWHHPTRGVLGPSEFIPLAQDTGMIVALDRWVLEEACRQLTGWSLFRTADDPLFVTVNQTAADLQSPDFIDDVRSILASSGLNPSQLVIEMTETMMLHDAGATVARLADLSSMGVQVAIDDFGTGYSSLGYLRRFNVDVLKIAREFVPTEEDGSDAWAFANAIIALGRTLGLRIIAEGVESSEQTERLRAMGCDLGQGYVFSHPLPANEIDNLLRQKSAPVAVVPSAIQFRPQPSAA